MHEENKPDEIAILSQRLEKSQQEASEYKQLFLQIQTDSKNDYDQQLMN